MARRDDDEEIRGESPHNGAQSRHPHLEVEGAQQDVESEQHNEHIPHIRGQKQLIHLLDIRQRLVRLITGSKLIGRHPTEQRVRPTGRLTRPVIILFRLTARTDSGHSVMLGKDPSFKHCRTEIGERDEGEKHDCQNIRQKLFQSFHKSFLLIHIFK